MNPKRITTHTITVNNRKYKYTLEPISKNTTYVKCKDAKISQEFLNDDIADLLLDLPNLIIAEKEHKLKQNTVIRFRVTIEDKVKIEKIAHNKGYSNVSSYLRDISLG